MEHHITTLYKISNLTHAYAVCYNGKTYVTKKMLANEKDNYKKIKDKRLNSTVNYFFLEDEILMDFGQMTLMKLLDYYENRKLEMSLDDALKIIFEIYRMIKELKDNNLYHRDTKPDNIIITKNGMKFIDFECMV